MSNNSYKNNGELRNGLATQPINLNGRTPQINPRKYQGSNQLQETNNSLYALNKYATA